MRFKVLDDGVVHEMVTQVYPNDDYAWCGVEFREHLRGAVVRSYRITDAPLTCLVCVAETCR